MPHARRRNFHVPLSESVYEKLRDEATRSGEPATELARQAIEAALTERRRLRLGESIATYAEAAAGTADDLDPALERSATQHLVRRRRRRP